MHGTPSTSIARALVALDDRGDAAAPKRSIASGVDQRERHVDHPLEVVDGDPLVGRVDVLHPVREVEAREPALVEDVRVGRAAAEPVARRVAASARARRARCERPVVALEAVAAIALRHLRLDLAVLEPGRERERVDHLLHELSELALVVGARLGVERAPLRNDVPAVPPWIDADVGSRLLVDPAEPEVGDRARRGRDRGASLLGVHAGVRGAAVEAHLIACEYGAPRMTSPIGAAWS